MLTTAHLAQIRRLPPKAAGILLYEIQDPTSHEGVIEILEARDPVAALARDYSQIFSDAVSQALRDPLVPDVGVEGLRRYRKKITRAVRRVSKKVGRATVKKVGRASWKGFDRFFKKFQKVHGTLADKVSAHVKKVTKKLPVKPKKVKEAIKKVTRKVYETGKKVLPYAAATATGGVALLAFKKHRARIIKQFKAYAPIAVPIAGVVLAPFTGGASVAVAALYTQGNRIYQAKKAAAAAKKAQKAEAAAMAAAARVEDQKLNAELDAFYSKYADVFFAAGVGPEKWATLSTEAKLGIIKKINDGEMPITHQVPGVPTQSQPTTKPPVTVKPTPTKVPAPPPKISAPKAVYDVYVEGKKVGEASNVKAAADIARQNTKVGDRFEILVNGQSTGLKIRGTKVPISVPAKHSGQVRAASPADVRKIVKKAEERVTTEKKPGFPIWVLPVAAAAALVAA